MPFLKLCNRVFVVLFIWYLTPVYSKGQSCLYTDREMLFDDQKDNLQVILSSDGSTHVWRWGTGRVTLDVYDKQLHRVQTEIISRKGIRLVFARFQSKYYVLLTEPKTTRVLCISNNDWEDKTADFNRIPIEDMPIAQMKQSEDLWFFIQYSPTDDEEHSHMHVTAVDSNLQFVNSMHLTLRYTTDQVRRLRMHTLGNDLLLMQTRVQDTAMKMTMHKLNIYQGTVRSNTFLFNDEQFVPQQILPYGNGFVVEGQASRPLLPPRRQTAYTYLLQIDSNLQQVSRYSTAANDSSLPLNALCHYLPVSTTALPNNQLLIADYLRNMNPKTKGFETRLRLHQLDSTLTLVNSSAELTKDYSSYPALVFSSGPRVMIFYEEIIKRDIGVVHYYRYGAGPESDRIVQLNPKNRYYMRSAIRTSETSFIMPYLRNYKLGLVRVNVAVEE